MISELDKLNEAYYIRFWELKNNFTALPEEQYKSMCEVLHKQYLRDYAILDGQAGLEIDRQVAQLNLQRDRQEKATELELKKQELENALKRDIAAKVDEYKRGELIPADLPKRWWQLRAQPNAAKILAMQEAIAFADKEREKQTKAIQAMYEASPEPEEPAQIPEEQSEPEELVSEEQSEPEDELSALDEYQSGEAEYAEALKLAAEKLISAAKTLIERGTVAEEAEEADEPADVPKPEEAEQITLIELAGESEDELAELEELQEIEEEDREE